MEKRLLSTQEIASLYERYAHMIYTRICKMLPGHLAEEIVQDTFKKLCEKPEINTESNLLAYLYVISMNLAKDKIRRLQCKPMYVFSQECFPVEEVIEAPDTPEQVLTRVELQKAFKTLSHDQQQVLLDLLSGYKAHEMAQKYQVHPSTIWKKLQQAREQLQEAL